MIFATSDPRRGVLAALLFVFPLLLSAQTATLTMSDAILKGRSALAPANLRQLQWVPGTAQFTHVVQNKFVRVNAPDLATDTLDWLPKINEALEAKGAKPLSGMPATKWAEGLPAEASAKAGKGCSTSFHSNRRQPCVSSRWSRACSAFASLVSK